MQNLILQTGAVVFWLLVAMVPAAGQQHDLSLLAGATMPAAQVTALSYFSVSGGATIAGQFNYGYLLKESRSGQLYLEALAARVSHGGVDVGESSVDLGASQFYATAGLRYRLATRSRVSPYVAGGFGFGWFDGLTVQGEGPVATNVQSGFKPAFAAGGGVELRLTRWLGLKVDLRDFINTGTGNLRHNHFVATAGFSFHF